jgi:hypothetical protein
VPQSGGIGMGISILSYDGRIQFGVITDAGLVPDPHRIVDRFDDEFDKLMWLTLMTPWVDDAITGVVPTGDVIPAEAGTRSPKKKKIPKRFRNL